MQCIRCGRTTPEGRMFCETCAQTVSMPLEEAETRRIVLPDRDKLPPAPKPVKKTEPAPPPRGLRRLTAAVVALSLLCTLLLGAVGYGVYSYFSEAARQERSRQQLVAAENARLNTELDRLEDELAVALEEQKTLEDARQADAQKIQRLEDELGIYRMQTGDLETDLSALEQENLRLIDELDRAATEKRELNRSIEDLQIRLQTAESEKEHLEDMAAFVNAHVAFVGDDGTGYYHCYGCTYFDTAGPYQIYSTTDALAQGLTPCPYCH